MATIPTFPVSVAGFRADVFNYDPLLAGECISQSAKIAASLGVLKRGQVLYGPAPGTALTAATNLNTVPTGLQARVILAQDIDTGTGAAVTGLVYTAGKFLDTGMIFGSNGAASDAAQLWQFNVHVLTCMARSGQLVPMISLPATGGALPQSLSAKEARDASDKEVEAIKAAAEALPFRIDEEGPTGPATDPAWAIAAFGEREQTKEEQAREKAADAAADLRVKHQKAQDQLAATQAEELADLARKQREERAKQAERAQATKAQDPERPATGSTPPTPPKK